MTFPRSPECPRNCDLAGLSCLVLDLGHGRGLMDRAAAEQRTAELVAEYGSPDACPGVLLCDRHPGEAVAFTVVEPDLSYRDLTFGELGELSSRFAANLAALG